MNHGTEFSMNLEITRVDLEPAFPKKLVFEDGGGPTDDKQCTYHDSYCDNALILKGQISK
jgi:hypothetical protein